VLEGSMPEMEPEIVGEAAGEELEAEP